MLMSNFHHQRRQTSAFPPERILALAAVLLVLSSLFGQARAEVLAPEVLTEDHAVLHTSTVPANAGEQVKLFVREHVRSDGPDGNPRKAVLMIHGFSVPVLPGMDLGHDHYSWALWLAQAGFDVFMLDFQGSGASPLPNRNIVQMNDPCNVPTADQTRALIPNPLSATCPPSYPFQLINSQSDWSELDTVVDYIRTLRGVAKVALVSWSLGSFRVGPYAVQHPEKVESLFLLAPIFNPNFRSGTGPDGFGPPVALPPPGTPMSLRTRSDLMVGTPTMPGWDLEVKKGLEIGCEGQVEDGIQDVVWNAIMDNDELGRTWGPGSPPEGVMRVRTQFQWGWNATTAHKISVPVAIIAGELDTGTGAIQDFPRLYGEIPHDHKLWFKVQCAGHFMPWERQRRVLHHISKQWLKHGAVDEFTNGCFFVDTEGAISSRPCDRK